MYVRIIMGEEVVPCEQYLAELAISIMVEGTKYLVN